MIAHCGLDCSKCDAYIATINNDDELRESVAKLWSELNGVEITPEMINCEGCRVDGVLNLIEAFLVFLFDFSDDVERTCDQQCSDRCSDTVPYETVLAHLCSDYLDHSNRLLNSVLLYFLPSMMT